jgi:hypothetical protein
VADKGLGGDFESHTRNQVERVMTDLREAARALFHIVFEKDEFKFTCVTEFLEVDHAELLSALLQELDTVAARVYVFSCGAGRTRSASLSVFLECIFRVLYAIRNAKVPDGEISLPDVDVDSVFLQAHQALVRRGEKRGPDATSCFFADRKDRLVSNRPTFPPPSQTHYTHKVQANREHDGTGPYVV